MVEAQITWTDGERFVGSASSGHAMVIDSDRERNTARRRNADAQSGKTAGSGRHHHAVEIAKSGARFVHDPADERHQRFGMAAQHRQALARDDAALVGVENGRGAGS